MVEFEVMLQVEFRPKRCDCIFWFLCWYRCTSSSEYTSRRKKQ